MYCIQCGTRNTVGQATCDNCGAPMQPPLLSGAQSGSRCPMCATVNAPGAVYCAKCGARVRMLDGEEPEGSFAEWLPLSDGGKTEGAAPAPDEPYMMVDQVGASGHSWLDTLRSSAVSYSDPDDDSAPSPGVRLSAAEADPMDNSEEEDSDVPDWLRRLRERMAVEPEPEIKPSVSLRDRLGQSAGDNGVNGRSSLPDSAIDDSDRFFAADNMAGMRGEAAAPTPPPRPEANGFQWLQVGDEAPTEQTGAISAAEVPGEPPPRPQAPQFGRPNNTPNVPNDLALPDWLRNASESTNSDLSMADWNDWPAAGVPQAANAAAPWMQTDASAALPPPEERDLELPDWLRGDSAPTPAEPIPSANAAPAWLKNIPGASGDEEATPPAAPSQPEAQRREPISRREDERTTDISKIPAQANNFTETSELPDWLQELNPTTSSLGSAPTSSLPAWLRDEQKESASSVDDVDESELPTWLRDISDQGTPPAPAPTPPVSKPAGGRATGPLQISDSDLPDWMNGAAAQTAPVAPPAVQVPPAAEVRRAPPAQQPPANVPTVPPQAAPPAPRPATAPQPTNTPTPSGDTTVFTPASKAQPVQPPAPAEERGSTTAFTGPVAGSAPKPLSAQSGGGGPANLFFSEEDLPAWLREIKTEPAEDAVPVEEPAAPVAEPVAPGGMPAWLQTLRGNLDEESPTPALMVDMPEAPMLPLVTQTAQTIQLRPPREGAVQLLGTLLAPPAAIAAAEVAPAARQRMTLLAPERIIGLFVLLVVVAMWVFQPLEAATATAPVTQYGTNFANVLNNTPKAQPLLLVYDWDGSRYAEMSELSRSVTRAARAGGYKFATLSLIPEGEGFAQQISNEAFDQSGGSVCSSASYGRDFLHLGYYPGNEAAVAKLVANGIDTNTNTNDFTCNRSLAGYSLLGNTTGVQQFGAIVLLSGTDNALRLWVEQAGSRESGVPLLVAAPEAMRPAAEPYLQTNQLKGGLFGINGAQELEQTTFGATANNELGALLHTQAAALYILALALLVGFFLGAYRWINQPGRR